MNFTSINCSSINAWLTIIGALVSENDLPFSKILNHIWPGENNGKCVIKWTTGIDIHESSLLPFMCIEPSL